MKIVQVIILFLFSTGVLLVDEIELSWNYFKIMQLSHIVLSIIFFIVVLIPFVHLHLFKHKKIVLKKKEKKHKYINSGFFTGIFLFLVFISGIYLFLFGNSGSIYGEIFLNIHFYSSLLLLFFLFYHSYYLKKQGK
ncbi:hypothetical protein [Malaciobacter mytili]|uniref:hypothetical protein n=1 Tax=Malaciobacter mytili TaxID=603050 RepID=UPI003A8645F4